MSTQSRIEAESHKDPQTLEREIDQQRDAINDLVNRLETKLSPGQLLDQALSYTKGHGGEFAGNLGNTVKANPLPTLLTGVGLAWLMMGQKQTSGSAHSDSHLGANVGQRMSDVKARASDMRHSAGESLGAARQRVGDSGRHVAESVREQSVRARQGFQTVLEEQPLVLGAVGLALGALLGASLPSTRQEDELMGDARDRFADKAKQATQEGYAKASDIGQEVKRDVSARLHAEQNDRGDRATSRTSGLHS